MITQGPSNTVADIGKQVKLNCVANETIDYWFLSKNGESGSEEAIVNPGCSIVNNFKDHYAVESLGQGTTCNLVVFDITLEQAGVYRCSEAQHDLFSILTVIG